ncbi:hypothetical protein [Flavihumibacter petaseus]|uniref:Uncharacterized protein n=1 Tax=Flavihumibacter petaseus NBRC 106054 TaxID=1220578 RepID=A0A0E9N6G2_9BACT|nr:hypothetical protein [Flavihumibacter petaseus]GAO45378.1 hypothetical protein FPE01S_05_00750 [Flavihumibacter petaseus NBRC 106054]
MTGLASILSEKFPWTGERIEGQLAFQKKFEIVKLDCPELQKFTGLAFYKAKFSTGYRKFSIIDIVIGVTEIEEVYLLINPLFADSYSTLLKPLEEIKSSDAGPSLISEIVFLFKETGAVISKIDGNRYQLWFGNEKWRVMIFALKENLVLRIVPNSSMGVLFRIQNWIRDWVFYIKDAL